MNTHADYIRQFSFNAIDIKGIRDLLCVNSISEVV